MEGVSIGGRNITNIRYADDKVLIANTEIKLQRLVGKLDEECKKYGLKINISKTDVMGLTNRASQLPVSINLES